MTKLVTLSVVACLSGCAVGESVRIRVESDDSALVDVGVKAVEAWSRLGFRVDPDGARVTFTRVVGLVTPDRYANLLLGWTDVDGRAVEVDASLSGDRLQHVMTHELGHVLFGADHLTGPGDVGVMHYNAQWQLEPTQQDYDLACREAGVCL